MTNNQYKLYDRINEQIKELTKLIQDDLTEVDDAIDFYFVSNTITDLTKLNTIIAKKLRWQKEQKQNKIDLSQVEKITKKLFTEV